MNVAPHGSMAQFLRFLQFAPVSIVPLTCALALASQSQRDAEVTTIVHRGEELNSQGKYDEAIVELRRALDIDPHRSYALFRTAEKQLKLRNIKAAGDALREALSGDLRPKWIQVWSYLNIGKIYDIRGQRDRALPM